MIKARKILIWLAVVAALVVVYIFYTHVVQTPPIPVADSGTRGMELPDFERSPDVGGVEIAQTGLSRFIDYDEQGNILQVFGFEKLLNPKGDTNRREVVNPYLKIFEKKFLCSITSKSGIVEVEKVGGRQNAKDAELSGDVVIEIYFTEDDTQAGNTIYLDDLYYNSDRSEFTTDKAVRLVSDTVELTGRGMDLIYNAKLGRLEYFSIVDLNQLRIKQLSRLSSKSESTDKNQTPDGTETSTEEGSQSTEGKSSDSKSVDYYECRFKKDVEIEYGDEILVVGMEDVTISNILWSGKSDKDKEKETASEGGGEIGEVDGTAEKTEDNLPAEDSIDVVIRCKGGLVVRPITSLTVSQVQEGFSLSQIVEFNGRPVKIRKFASVNDVATFITCGILRYDVDGDILDMFTNAYAKNILFDIRDSEARLETSNSVRWERTAKRARIGGPGKLFLKSKKKTDDSAAEDAEVEFKGSMDLYFADGITDDGSEKLIIKAVNLAGGMTAAIINDTSARASADTADLSFTEDSKITAAELSGNVLFTALDDKDKGRARADSALFAFNDESELQSATLQGEVEFSSTDGTLQSQQAKILFGRDSEGKVVAKSFESTGEPVLTPISKDTSRPNATFKSQKIDYDLLTGNAIAKGPVEFTFYMADTKDQSGQKNIPVVITAQKQAEFIAGDNGKIERIVLSDNVKGLRQVQRETYTQKDSFTGETLTVELNNSAETSEQVDIGRVTIAGEDVKFESIRTAEEKTVRHVRLTCRQGDWYADGDVVIAAGPGVIEFINRDAEAQKTEKQKDLSFKQPCFAQIKGFDKLRWAGNSNEVIAEGKGKSVIVGYVPIIEGELGPVVNASAGRIVATLSENDLGESEMDTLYASGGISYEEEDGHILLGESLFYEGATSLMRIVGSDDVPCKADNITVPEIEYNLATGKIKFKLTGIPAVLAMPSTTSGQ